MSTHEYAKKKVSHETRVRVTRPPLAFETLFQRSLLPLVDHIPNRLFTIAKYLTIRDDEALD